MKDFISKILGTAINRYLALDPESHKRVTRLNEKIITMQLKGIGVDFQLKIQYEKIKIQNLQFNNSYSVYLEPHDVLIKGTPLALLGMSLSKENRKRFFAEDVVIEGNLELGQQIIDLFDELEIDWEELLSNVIGDIPAHQVGKAAKGFKNFTQRFKNVVLQNINEYVHEEALVFPPREALNDFFREVDMLRMDTDRLELKIKHLKENL